MWLRTVFLAALAADAITASSETKYDTIIIGMGAAGCAAASVLSRAGKKVLAFEAQNRVGGRVHTEYFGSGVVELGAQWLHGSERNPIYNLAMENNVPILEQNFTFNIHRRDNSTPEYAIFVELLELIMEKRKQPPKEPEPVGDYLTREIEQYMDTHHSDHPKKDVLIKEFLNFIGPMINSLEAASDWNDLTTHGNFESLEGAAELTWDKYGYKTLIEILLNTYNGGEGYSNLEIKMNVPIKKISYPSDPSEDVEVTCNMGNTFRAKNVIVTISYRVLKETHETFFSPKLSQEKVKSFDYIGMESYGKIIMDFDYLWWTPDVNFNLFLWRDEDIAKVPEEDYWTTKIIGPHRTMGSDTSIMFWTTGESSKLIEVLPHDVVMNKCMELIRTYMGKNITIPDAKDMLRTSWFKNPYIRGAHSYDNVKFPSFPQAREVLAAPINDDSGKPRVIFAGEAMSNHHYSTVHGAVESGFEAAKGIIDND